MKTWHFELAFVATVLLVVYGVASPGDWRELIGSAAVLASFAYSQIADRLTEREARRSAHEVHCWRWSLRYFLLKEALWLAYFVAHRSWSALVGVGVFLAYPIWRGWYRKRWPPLVDGSARGETVH